MLSRVLGVTMVVATFGTVAACAGDSDNDAGGGGASAVAVGSTTSGGGGEETTTAPATNSTNVATTSSTGSGSEPIECPHEGEPIIDPSLFPLCPSEVCGETNAHCVPTAAIPADQQDAVAQLADCDADNKCVPDIFIETMGNFIPDTCASLLEAEGRCLSVCIPEIAGMADMLPQDICGAGEVCAPCYDPIDQSPTGACELSCDVGPVEPPPEPLPGCCEDDDVFGGTCVPTSAIPPEDADSLAEDDCPDGEDGSGLPAMLCVPNEILADPNWEPTVECETGFFIQAFLGSDYAEGGCLPECLGAVQQFGISQSDCPDGYKCAPCKDPDTEGPSGACPWWTG